MPNLIHPDDAAIGRVLSRREALGLMGTAGAGGLLILAGCASSSAADPTDVAASLDCVARPALTQGPYFVDERLNRSDIRSDTATGAVKAGTLLTLRFNVMRLQSDACTPLAGAMVDVWHCDAVGVYSDAQDPGFNTVGQNWLRGFQNTDANGVAGFTTIFPGWYPGRATHVHFKIRGAGGGSFDFTSQLFFSESFLSSAYTVAPYNSKNDAGRLRNGSDGIYNQSGSQLLLTPTTSGGAYDAAITIGLQL